MKKLYESFIKRRGMGSIPQYHKTVAPLYFADTYGGAIRKPLRKVYQTTGMVEPYPNTPSRGVTQDRINRGVAL